MAAMTVPGPASWSFTQVAGTQAHGPASIAFPDAFIGSWMGSEVAETRTGALAWDANWWA